MSKAKAKVKKTTNKNKPRFSASGAKQWLNCEMSRTVRTGRNFFDDKESAAVGTAIHEYMDRAIKELMGGEKDFEISNASKLYYSRNKNFVDSFIDFYTKQINLDIKYAEGAKKNIKIESERKFEYETKKAVFIAKVDTIMYYNKDWIKIYDLKTGFVEIKADCEQMQITAMIIKKLFPQFKTIVSCIIQPGLNSVAYEDLSSINPDVLDEFNFHKPKYYNIGSQCVYCSGNIFCPKFKENLEYFTSPEFAGKSYDRSAECGDILEIAESTIKILKSVKENAMMSAKLGKLPEGWELGFKKIRRSFKSNLSSGIISKALGVNQNRIVKTSLESPAQVEKFLKTDKQKEVFKELISQPSAAYLKRIEEGL
jgi:hypothetical protein